MATFEQSSISSQALGKALDQIAVPTFIIDSAYRIVFANKLAFAILSQKGVVEYRRNDGIGGSNVRSNIELRRALDSVTSGETRQAIVALRSRSSDVPRTAIICRAPVNHPALMNIGKGNCHAIMFVINHEPRKVSPEPSYLAAVFKFTPKQAEIASLLAGGANLAEIARRMEVTREGVRYHLKQLFAKTGTHCQRELVQLVTAGQSLLLSS
ncbi:MAG: helix-turn-helix transcriptional regulator [Bauldia sp.]|nr:helix-turn-helix transcriptional regulator [Bauldia sp.]